MEHLAILKKSWNFLPKILAGEKKIESRWYKSRHAPWDKVRANEAVYFKESGEPVTIVSEVDRVLQFSELGPQKVRELLEKYGAEIGIEKSRIPYFVETFKDKKYCMLIFLKNPQKIEPFEIDKTGFGIMSAWVCVEGIDKIKAKSLGKK